jgi:23S rRNA pseudouridine955/2504/2580 synthase
MTSIDSNPRASGQVRLVRVPEDRAGQRLDNFLLGQLKGAPKSLIYKIVRSGQVRVNGGRARPETRLEGGDEVRIPPVRLAEAGDKSPPPKGLLAALEASIVFEDARLLAINKPSGLASHGGSGISHGAIESLRALRPRESLELVHRLDRDTSGLLVVARSQPIARELAFAFQQHRVRKLYWAVVVGRPQRNEGEIDLALAKQGGPGRERMEADAAGRRARTAWRVLAAAGKAGAWLALLPLTGRTHQLRAHCAALGCPIQGDAKYGGRMALPTGAPEGLMLHAREIDLPLPGGRRLRLAAEPPAVFRLSLKRLGIEPGQFPGATLADWP